MPKAKTSHRAYDPSRTFAYVAPTTSAPALPISIPGEGTVQVAIGERPFLIGEGDAANARRQQYFSGTLVAQGLLQGEQDILDYFKIDAGVVGSLLPEFFRTLPKCQSDTNVFLKRGCEPVYQVLWMMKMSRGTKGAAELRARETALAPLGGIVSAIDLANITTLFSSFDRDMTIARIQQLVQTV